MVRWQGIECFNILFQDISYNEKLFGGKVVVFGGDFRQILPVIPKASDESVCQLSISFSLMERLNKAKAKKKCVL